MGLFGTTWLVYLGLTILLVHTFSGISPDAVGPFRLDNYLFPTLLFGVPQILFFGGVAFLLGTWTRRPIIVFAFPLVALLVTLSFLIGSSPSWLAPEVSRLLMLVDPSGFRWLNETFLSVDRGVEFYNTQPLRPDLAFALSRAAIALAGLRRRRDRNPQLRPQDGHGRCDVPSSALAGPGPGRGPATGP